MALLALTQNNIDFIKVALRAAYPEVKAAHRAEAVAYATGHRTNIALVTHLRESDPRNPKLVDLDGQAFVTRLAEFGYVMGVGRRLDNVARSNDLPDRVWRTFRAGDYQGQNDWYSKCEGRNIPYIYIAERRKFANVYWDCIVLNSDLDEVTRGPNSSELSERLVEAFMILAKGHKRIGFDGSSWVGKIEDVPLDMAPEFADALFRILYEATREGSAAASLKGTLVPS